MPKFLSNDVGLVKLSFELSRPVVSKVHSEGMSKARGDYQQRHKSIRKRVPTCHSRTNFNHSQSSMSTLIGRGRVIGRASEPIGPQDCVRETDPVLDASGKATKEYLTLLSCQWRVAWSICFSEQQVTRDPEKKSKLESHLACLSDRTSLRTGRGKDFRSVLYNQTCVFIKC